MDNMEKKEACAIDTGAVYAAISMAFYEMEEDVQHDEENVVITIQHVSQAYSPWSSKVHVLREVPVLRK